MAVDDGGSSVAGPDSDDEMDWEEVQVPEVQKHLEITLSARPKQDVAIKKKGISHAERLLRIDCHKIHTICLLVNARIRNKWINDPLLHARLLSLAPLTLQNSFALIHKSRVPDPNQRGRLFESAITRLTSWWANDFFRVTTEGHIRSRTFDEVQKRLVAEGLSRTKAGEALDLTAVQDALDDDGELVRSPKSLMKHALMQRGSRDMSAQLFTALCRALSIPSRLVVSLQSVPWQAGVGKPKPKYERKVKGKGKADGYSKADEKEEMVEVNIPAIQLDATINGKKWKGKAKADAFTGDRERLDGGSTQLKSEKAKGKEKAGPIIKLRKIQKKGRVLGSSATPEPSGSISKRLEPPDPRTSPPVFWTEVFSRADGRWLPVDPVRGIVNKRKAFDPSPSTSAPAPMQPSIYPPSHPLAPTPSAKKATRITREENRMAYVLAFEEDGYAKDVTRRYAREFGAKIAKVQSVTLGGSGGKGRKEWWEGVAATVQRPYRLHRDDVEDEELEANQMMEGMPTTIAGFKDHPIYVLARHLKQNQTLHPPPPDTPELGSFRGEPVYPRSAVVNLKTAENWMRSEGRRVQAGCQPMKWVKMRAGTVGKLREVEVLKEEMRERRRADSSDIVIDMAEPSASDRGRAIGSEGEVMQGLYARSQTEAYVPDPISNGKVPKNNFGNIDLYVPSMLPEGGVHVPYKGVAKIARKLGFDYAEAVTGFEFKKRRALPVIEGVVVAAENEPMLLEAYWEAERDAEEKARIKRHERVIKRWTRLVHGLRIRHRLQEQYARRPNQGQNRDQTGAQMDNSDASEEKGLEDMPHTGGGFLVGADDVVQRYQLPRDQHIALPPVSSAESPHIAPLADPSVRAASVSSVADVLHDPYQESVSYGLETLDVDSDMEEEPIPAARPVGNGVPKTMLELAAEDEARAPGESKDRAASDDEYRASPEPALLAPDVGLNTVGQQRSRGRKAASTTKRAQTAARTSRRRISKKRARSDTDDGASSGSRSPPAKRGRSAKAIPQTQPTPAPTRTLRPRASKSAAAIQEEKEREDAFRRAIAQ